MSSNRRTLLALLGGSIATPWLAPRIALTQEAWPDSPAQIKAFRDAEEIRLLLVLKAAGIKPE